MEMFLAILLALLVSALVLALLLRLAPRTGLMDHPGERRRIHRRAVPRVGGLAIFAGLLATLAALVPYLLCNLGPCPRRWKVFLGDGQHAAGLSDRVGG